jgi:two-component system chemotaxis sensor kinase CheA
MHTLKGAAHMVNLFDVVEACQSLESLLAALKRGDITLGVNLLDRLHAAIDSLGRLIFRDEGMDSGEESARLKGLILEMETLAKEDESATAPIPHAGTAGTEWKVLPFQREAGGGETIKVPVQVLDALLPQAEADLGQTDGNGTGGRVGGVASEPRHAGVTGHRPSI